MLTLIIPAYTAGPNIERTINSVSSICDDVVIISTSPYKNEAAKLRELGVVIQLPWNHVFLHGFGDMMNQGSAIAKNDWLLLFGVAETLAEPYGDMIAATQSSPANHVFRCSHANDINQWKRVWNRTSGVKWSGLIHEELIGGEDRGLLFRMQDTDKIPSPDPVRNEVFRFIKTLSYNAMYHRLLHDQSQLGGTDRGWLGFVEGAKESIESFMECHKGMLDACFSGDFKELERLVVDRMNQGQPADGVIYTPTGV